MSAEAGPLRIVFDFGGVLFNWRPIELVQRHLPRQATDAASTSALVAAVFQGFGGDWAQFDRGLLDAPQLVRRIAARTGLDAGDLAALVDGVAPSLTPKPDTVDLLLRLRAAGAPLHFLSNMPRPYAEHLDRSHPNLMGCFRSGLYSSHVRLIKPEAELFELARSRFAAAGDRLLLLDDIAANVDAARANGWLAVQFIDARDCERALRANGWWPGG
ncbi:MAG TPA: HAD family phosphatase [Burkholderiaceae bacterium]